jgi:hypothetical protein
MRQMRGFMGSASLIDFRGAEKGNHEGAAIASFGNASGITAETFAANLEAARGKTANGVTVVSVTQRTIGQRTGVIAEMSSATFIGSIVFIPEDTSMVMVFVGGDSAAAAGDTTWIVDHLTTG